MVYEAVLFITDARGLHQRLLPGGTVAADDHPGEGDPSACATPSRPQSRQASSCQTFAPPLSLANTPQAGA